MAVAKGSDTALRVAKAEEKKEGCSRTMEDGATVIEEIVQRREGREAITFGMRVGEVKGIIHGAQWKQYASSSGKGNRYEAGGTRGCPMKCGVKCTIQHVVMGECIACVGTSSQRTSSSMRGDELCVGTSSMLGGSDGNDGASAAVAWPAVTAARLALRRWREGPGWCCSGGL